MTGGSPPAMTWHEIMAFAHQGIELKAIPGLGPQAPSRPVVAENKENKKDGAAETPPSRSSTILTKRGADALVRVERLMDDATRALAASGTLTKASNETAPRPPETFASVSDQEPAGQARGD